MRGPGPARVPVARSILHDALTVSIDTVKLALRTDSLAERMVAELAIS